VHESACETCSYFQFLLGGDEHPYLGTNDL